ncbi:hypothetical protein ACCS88_21280 [Rhizobium ruizarguesonis]|nr:hypothetical protein [Rhizobium leguminosarum]
MRHSYRNPQKKSVLFRPPGLLIGALAFGAAGGMTVNALSQLVTARIQS